MMGEGATPTPSTLRKPLAADQERSAFIIFAEYASRHVLETHEVRALVTQVWSLKPSLFHVSQKALDELGPALGLDPVVYSRAFGRDVEQEAPAKKFVAELRHCHVCLSMGCHSALFQLPAVAYCPVHAVRLRCGCPHCGAAIPASAFSVGRHHLYCGKCGRNLSADRRRDSLGGEVTQLPSLRFEALREAASNLHGEERSRIPFVEPPGQIAASVGLGRLLASHTMWFDQPVPGLDRFRVERLPLEDEHKPPHARSHALERNAYIDAFVELAGELERYIRLDGLPMGAESGTHSAARVDAELQLVSAAFWHAAATFGVHRFVRGEMPPPTARASPFAFSLPRGTQAMRQVVSRQVQTLFAHNVLRLRHLRYGAEITWFEVPPHPTFLVPWRICRRRDGIVELQIRARVDSATISRIVRRYRYARLTRTPADFDIGAILGGKALPPAVSDGRSPPEQPPFLSVP